MKLQNDIAYYQERADKSFYNEVILDIEADLLSANLCLERAKTSGNDYLYNRAGYAAQQATEKLLKCYLRDIYGENETDRNFQSHEITVLARRLERDYGHSVLPFIKKNAREITELESESRYNHHSVKEKRELIETVMQTCERMLTHVKRLYHFLEDRGYDPTTLTAGELNLLSGEEQVSQAKYKLNAFVSRSLDSYRFLNYSDLSRVCFDTLPFVNTNTYEEEEVLFSMNFTTSPWQLEAIYEDEVLDHVPVTYALISSPMFSETYRLFKGAATEKALTKAYEEEYER